MPSDTTLLPATSSAATRQTEPEVIAGISSGEGGPDTPLSIRVGGFEFGVVRTAAMLAAGMGLGYLAARMLFRRD